MRLGDIATVESGSGFPLAEQGHVDRQIPFLKVSDMNLPGNSREITSWNNSIDVEAQKRLRARVFPPHTIIFPKIGAAIATNKKRILRVPSCIDNNCMGVTGDTTRVVPEYLFYLFASKDLSEFASDSNPPSIRKSEVEKWDIALPSIPEQRRIVELLSRAESIARMRREAAAKSKAIVPALFLDMFPEAIVAEGRTRDARKANDCKVRLGEVADVQGGLQVTQARVDLPLECSYLRVANVHRDYIDLSEVKTIRATSAELGRTVLRDGDLLIVEGHGNPSEVGRVGIWNALIEPCTHQNHLIRVRCMPNKLVPAYAWAYLNSAQGRQLLLRQGKTTSGLNTISVSNVKNVFIPRPPIERQRTFAERVAEARTINAAQSRAQTVASAAFHALLASLFESVR